MKIGKVYLIGAGPGSIDLITIKGFKIIQSADVIVYDRLANPRLLNYKREDAELIYVGKTPNHHTLKQEEINELLVKLAKEGKVVARLKGGDPYVFGRGGEEAELLRTHNILFEVVPGISSSIAAPSYAGIPVTHRNVAVNFTVITGHENPSKSTSQINWKRLAEDNGTLIFLMGVSNLEKIVFELIENGKSRETPVALIQWGTRPEQRVVTGTLETIVSVVRSSGITSPAIIIVGEVVKMRDVLSWYEDKPLFGKRILVTRSREQASILSEKIEELGGEAWEYPTIKINTSFDDSKLRQEISNLTKYQWLVFASVNAFKAFKKVLIEERIDIRNLINIKIFAIGKETKQEIESSGLIVEAMPEKFVAEEVKKALSPLINLGDNILIPRSNLGRKILVDSLIELGANVSEVIAYETILAEDNDTSLLLEKLVNNEIHLLTFTSASTVSNFVKLIGKENLDLINNIDIASIGPVTSKKILEYNLKVTIEAKEHTIDGLISEILSYYKKGE